MGELYKYLPVSARACAHHAACLEKRTSDELLRETPPLQGLACRPYMHAPDNAITYTACMSMLQDKATSVGANDPILSRRCVPDESLGKSRAGRLLAACSQAPVPFRDSSGSYFPAVWVVSRKTEARVRGSPQSGKMEHPSTQPSHHTTPTCAQAPSSHITVISRVPCSHRAPAMGL